MISIPLSLAISSYLLISLLRNLALALFLTSFLLHTNYWNISIKGKIKYFAISSSFDNSFFVLTTEWEKKSKALKISITWLYLKYKWKKNFTKHILWQQLENAHIHSKVYISKKKFDNDFYAEFIISCSCSKMTFLAFFLFWNFFFIIDITNNYNFKLKHSFKKFSC